MKKKIEAQWLMALFALITLVSLIAFAGVKNASVSSTPLDCYSQEEKTICFDGQPGANMTCEMLDLQTMLCSAGD
ncbi:MAG TPA: hypothetical protein VM425_06880 [Myxococcota bacterium]|nr:hypothetical protein [Myxococcota bacterium]